MSDPQLAIVMLGLFIFMVLLGFPIAFTLIAMGLAFGYYAYWDPERMQTLFDNRIFDLFVQNTFSVMSNDVLVAVPLFLFMGYVVERANIVNRLFFQGSLHGRWRTRTALSRAPGASPTFITRSRSVRPARSSVRRRRRRFVNTP